MSPRVVVVSFALAACAVDDKQPGVPDDPPSDATSTSERNVALAVVDATGAAVDSDVFAQAEDVHFALNVLDPAKPVVAEDYMFQVISPDGSVLSSDEHACRRFHVSTQGVIDGVHPASLATGAACTHDFERTATRALLVQAMPFAMGSSSFVLEIAPLADGTFANAVAVAFEIAAPPPPPQEDDDNNDDNNDDDNDDNNDDDDDDDDGPGSGSGNGNGNGNGKK